MICGVSNSTTHSNLTSETKKELLREFFFLWEIHVRVASRKTLIQSQSQILQEFLYMASS